MKQEPAPPQLRVLCRPLRAVFRRKGFFEKHSHLVPDRCRALRLPEEKLWTAGTGSVFGPGPKSICKSKVSKLLHTVWSVRGGSRQAGTRHGRWRPAAGAICSYQVYWGMIIHAFMHLHMLRRFLHVFFLVKETVKVKITGVYANRSLRCSGRVTGPRQQSPFLL
ncbi:hypothetical protein HG535_0B01150 [Zygotorulaspora mrakii]|uniref:Uncharacterized protein n=1 Tax=Zygotorulaspora mrakii TaxID=42260 RepID=A0A7H9AY34_ZYGMR|nr:uncharacterized protein HG535_0B01150 [Zygotorulaspora mrakii]QLG71077.1 hypothetical protein HG535_0B01150 [Zygotorulaspora mrakii]